MNFNDDQEFEDCSSGEEDAGEMEVENKKIGRINKSIKK